MKRQAKPPLPDDVEHDQLWQAPDGQHYRVLSVSGESAELQRATPAGTVLNVRYRKHESVERMQAEWKLVRGV